LIDIRPKSKELQDEKTKEEGKFPPRDKRVSLSPFPLLSLAGRRHREERERRRDMSCD
jgi:hypothetical protein